MALADDALGEARGRCAADVDCEGRAGHMLVGELDVDVVHAGLGWLVSDAAAAVLVVVALDVGFAWAFDREAQAAVALRRRRREECQFTARLGLVCEYSAGKKKHFLH